MSTTVIWKCPGCGNSVSLRVDEDESQGQDLRARDLRLNRLAQAVCGCWVRRLSTDELDGFLGEVMGQRRRNRSATGS